MSLTFNNATNCYCNSQWFSDLLGTRHKIPGFIKNYEKQIALTAIIVPIAIDALKFLVTYKDDILSFLRIIPKKETNEASVSYKERVITFLDDNKFNVITIVFFATMFLIFRDTNPSVIYLAYSVINLTHFVGMVQDFKAGDKLNFVKHLFGSLSTTFTIANMIRGIYEVRWHHMSYGQITMLPNLMALNIFGSLMVIDSLLYMIKPQRDDFDFGNVFDDYLPGYLSQLIILTVCEVAAKIFGKSTSEPEKDIELNPV